MFGPVDVKLTIGDITIETPLIVSGEIGDDELILSRDLLVKFGIIHEEFPKPLTKSFSGTLDKVENGDNSEFQSKDSEKDDVSIDMQKELEQLKTDTGARCSIPF